MGTTRTKSLVQVTPIGSKEENSVSDGERGHYDHLWPQKRCKLVAAFHCKVKWTQNWGREKHNSKQDLEEICSRWILPVRSFFLLTPRCSTSKGSWHQPSYRAEESTWAGGIMFLELFWRKSASFQRGAKTDISWALDPFTHSNTVGISTVFCP